MIEKVQIKSGILKKLLDNRTFQFTEGLNIIWSGNGKGKSLLLKTMAEYCFVSLTGGGGWSKENIFFKFSEYSFNYESKNKNLSDVYEFNKNSKIDIDWSGDAVFYMHHDDMIDWTHIMGYEMAGSSWIPGLGKISDELKEEHGYHPSSGQQIKTITNMLNNITVPDLTIKKDDKSYDSDTVSYIKTRKKTFKGKSNKPTLILDEVDSQLDMSNQIHFHETILPKLVEKFQVILVSHSVFALQHKHIIELDNSMESTRNSLSNFLSSHNLLN